MEVTTSRGRITRAPTRIASRAPNAAPATCPAAMARPITHHVAPEKAKTISEQQETHKKVITEMQAFLRKAQRDAAERAAAKPE